MNQKKILGGMGANPMSVGYILPNLDSTLSNQAHLVGSVRYNNPFPWIMMAFNQPKQSSHLNQPVLLLVTYQLDGIVLYYLWLLTVLNHQ